MKKVWIGVHLEEEEKKTSKFVDVGINNWNEGERELTTWSGSTRKNETENKSLGTER
jgi:hypothetical protein